MKTIPIEFYKDSFDFKLIKRVGTYAIYSKSKHDEVYAYEVIRINSRPDSTKIINGKEVFFEAGEVYPSNSEFGTNAWCYITYDNAYKEFSKLVWGTDYDNLMGVDDNDIDG